MNNVELDYFLGKHTLSGVDFGNYKWEDSYRGISEAMYIVVDGTTFTIVEDPNDGWRSMLSHIQVGGECKNTFEEIEVVGIYTDNEPYSNEEVIKLIDINTGKPVVEFGTQNVDDWYPCYVAHFSPQNMVINNESH